MLLLNSLYLTMKISHLSLIFLSLILFNRKSVYAQNAGVYINDVSGFPIRPATTDEISGTNYLNKDWQLGSVTVQNGKTYKNMLVKLDLLNHKFVFKGDKGETMGFVDPVAQVILDPTSLNTNPVILRNGFNGADVNPNDYLQVMTDGNVVLLKKMSIIIKEVKEYNSAVTEKSYVNKSSYYIAQKDKPLQSLALNKKGILNVLTAHGKEVEQYINDNKINFKKDEDIIKVINYYNSL